MGHPTAARLSLGCSQWLSSRRGRPGVPLRWGAALFRNSPVRLSLGRETTEEDIDYTVDAFVRVTSRLRDISPIWKRR